MQNSMPAESSFKQHKAQAEANLKLMGSKSLQSAKSHPESGFAEIVNKAPQCKGKTGFAGVGNQNKETESMR